jgi:dipeptidyl aminopeptidase/acylaminoacyl peptidase
MPNFRGPNLRPESCASELARQDVLDAVAYVRRTYAVDDTRVYLAGVSGGGHMSMVMAAHAPELWAGVSAWVGISDLTAWHAETKAAGRKYWKDVEAVVGGAPGASAAVDAQLRYRSPLYHVGGAKNVPLDLNTGIHDGHTGSVPIHHTIDAYNVLARAQGDDEVSAEDIATLSAEKPLSTTEKQDTTYGRHLHLRRYAGPSRVTVFEGGHEGIPRAACTWLEKQRKE